MDQALNSGESIVEVHQLIAGLLEVEVKIKLVIGRVATLCGVARVCVDFDFICAIIGASGLNQFEETVWGRHKPLFAFFFC